MCEIVRFMQLVPIVIVSVLCSLHPIECLLSLIGVLILVFIFEIVLALWSANKRAALDACNRSEPVDI